ncbi:probable protein phosphatase 2C 15 isoform X2 [Setaria italica]|uniref:probable protein phosphatase 2C 15 isoform X2 n=1 Tax=Setaria italica TaxID=4555 RepID=UPI000BE56D1D|nr:probable protein phosphatase 2C 15 isoform X2 [Setaria italica]
MSSRSGSVGGGSSAGGSSAGGGAAVPLAVLLRREVASERTASERPELHSGLFSQAKKGEDFTFLKPDCERLPGVPSSSFSAFGLFDGHNGNGAAIYTKENLLNNILSAVPADLNREDWLAALPRALVAAFVKTDKDFQTKARSSGTTVTFVIIDGLVITVASVGDSRCVLEAEGSIYHLSSDHRFDASKEEVDRVTESGGDVGRLNVVGGAELSTAGGRLIIASDGVWDALSPEAAFNCSRELPPEPAAEQIVKTAVHSKGLRDDTTCIVVDIVAEKNSSSMPLPKKQQGIGVFKNMFCKKKSSDSSSHADREYMDPDIVEEMFEDGCALLSRRLDSEYPVRNMFKLFICAICQVELKPNQGISVHEDSSQPGSLRRWDGPFLCQSCQEKKEAMEGKHRSRDSSRNSGSGE